MAHQRAKIIIDHRGCFSQLQREFPNLAALDINMAKPDRYKDREVLAGYLVLRGCIEDKKRFYELCKCHISEEMVFVSLNLVTDFDVEPTIVRYDVMEVAKPCIISVLYRSEVEYSWPLAIRIANGLEWLMVKGDEESIEEFRKGIEKEGVGTIEIDYVDEDAFNQELQAIEFDKEMILGFHILKILRDTMRSNVLNQKHNVLIEKALVNPGDESLKEICGSHELSYGTARQIVGRARRQIERDLRDVFRIVLSDLKGDPIMTVLGNIFL
jgi:hypothetical protein